MGRLADVLIGLAQVPEKRELPGVAYRRMIMWKILIVVPAVMLLGCTSDESVVESPASDQQGAEATPAQTDPLASSGTSSVGGGISARLVTIDMEGGLEALMSGTFSIRDGCVGIVDSNGKWQMAVFPESVRLVDDRLHFGDGNRTAAIGSLLDIGGGAFEIDEADRLAPGLASELAACPPSESLWIVNSRLP